MGNLSDLQQSLLGPDYKYHQKIKTPSELGVTDEGGLDQPSPQPSSVPVSPGDQVMLTSQINSLMKTAQELKLEQIANKLKLVANEGHINKMKEEQDKMKSEMEEMKRKNK